jgi:hypothetical protein
MCLILFHTLTLPLTLTFTLHTPHSHSYSHSYTHSIKVVEKFNPAAKLVLTSTIAASLAGALVEAQW